jgi:hypothetical protein
MAIRVNTALPLDPLAATSSSREGGEAEQIGLALLQLRGCRLGDEEKKVESREGDWN